MLFKLLLRTATRNKILDVTYVKYDAVIILDCIPNISHREQSSLSLLYVNLPDVNSAPEIAEGCYWSVGKILTWISKTVGGQTYNNGFNTSMKGKDKGVQNRIF